MKTNEKKARTKSTKTEKKLPMETNGKKASERVYTRLDQIWGNDGLSKYKTLDINEYERKLDGMSKVDLWEHAVSVQESVIDNKEILKKKLIKRFRQHVSQYRIIEANSTNGKVKKNPISEDVQKILNEGR